MAGFTDLSVVPVTDKIADCSVCSTGSQSQTYNM